MSSKYVIYIIQFVLFFPLLYKLTVHAPVNLTWQWPTQKALTTLVSAHILLSMYCYCFYLLMKYCLFDDIFNACSGTLHCEETESLLHALEYVFDYILPRKLQLETLRFSLIDVKVDGKDLLSKGMQ